MHKKAYTVRYKLTVWASKLACLIICMLVLLFLYLPVIASLFIPYVYILIEREKRLSHTVKSSEVALESYQGLLDGIRNIRIPQLGS